MTKSGRHVAPLLLTAVLFVALASAYGCAARLTASESQVSPEAGANRQVPMKLTLTLVGEVQDLVDLAILGNGDIWAAGYDGHDSERLYISKDGGRSWGVKSVPSGGFATAGIVFIDDRHGWAVGGSGLVLATNDGGGSWEKLGRPTLYELHKVQFVNLRVGYVASNTEWGCEIFRTTDGGKSWRKSYTAPRSGFVFDLAVLGEKIAVAAINDDHLIRTDDGGATWKTVNSKLRGAASVAFTSNGTGWVVGRKGSFYLSTDQGKTWKQPESLPKQVLDRDWTSIDFVDDGRGIAVGNEGAIAFSIDGGKTWSNQVEAGIQDNLVEVRLHGKAGLILGSQRLFRVEGWS